MPTEEKYRVVTWEQFRSGYREMIGGVVYHREYVLIRKDGESYIVREPEPSDAN